MDVVKVITTCRYRTVLKIRCYPNLGITSTAPSAEFLQWHMQLKRLRFHPVGAEVCDQRLFLCRSAAGAALLYCPGLRGLVYALLRVSLGISVPLNFGGQFLASDQQEPLLARYVSLGCYPTRNKTAGGYGNWIRAARSGPPECGPFQFDLRI